MVDFSPGAMGDREIGGFDPHITPFLVAPSEGTSPGLASSQCGPELPIRITVYLVGETEHAVVLATTSEAW